jgi:hypothetical protein
MPQTAPFFTGLGVGGVMGITGVVVGAVDTCKAFRRKAASSEPGGRNS